MTTDAPHGATSGQHEASTPTPSRPITVDEKIRAMTPEQARARCYRLTARIAAILEGIWLAEEGVFEDADQDAANVTTLALVALLRADLTRLHTVAFHHPDTTAHTRSITLDFGADL